MSYSARLMLYATTLVRRYEARDAMQFELEDALLGKLDELWLAMSEDDRDRCDQVARETKQAHYTRISATTDSDDWIGCTYQVHMGAATHQLNFIPSLIAA